MRYLPILFPLLLPAALHAATIQTTDHQTLTGTLSVDDTSIILTPLNAPPIHLNPANILSIQNPPDAAPTTAPAPPTPTGNLKSQFFSDPTFTHRTTLRGDPNINFDCAPPPPTSQPTTTTQPEIPKDSTDPALPPGPFSARFTATLYSPTSETYTFFTVAQGRARAYLDDILLLNYRQLQATAPLTANHPHTLRVDYIEPTSRGYLRLEWQSPHTPRQHIPANCLSPNDSRIPVVQLIQPINNEFFVETSPINIESSAKHGNGIPEISFLLDELPFSFFHTKADAAVWKIPSLGIHHLAATVTSDEKITSRSAPATFTVAAAVHSNLPQTWGAITLGNFSLPPNITTDHNTFTLKHTGDSNPNHATFLLTPVDGDFTFTARLASLETFGSPLNQSAGLQIRDSLRENARQLALQISPNAATPPPLFLRLVRHENRVTTYHSKDALSWQPVDSQEFPNTSRLFLGPTVTGNTKNLLAQATFDHLLLLPFSPPESLPAGLLTTDNSFLTGQLTIAENQITLQRPQQQLIIPTSQIARLLLQPTNTSTLEKIDPAQTGALTTQNKFIEGRITQLTPTTLTLDTFNNGPLQLPLKTLTTILLHPLTPAETTQLEIHFTDHSTLRGSHLQSAPPNLTIALPHLDPIQFSPANLLNLQTSPPN